MKINKNINEINKILVANNLTGIIVGGYVRDTLLSKYFPHDFIDISPKDIDIEVHGNVSYAKLARLLSPLGKVNLVGEKFGVLKLFIGDDDFDISLPRTENNVGVNHSDVNVSFGNISMQKAFQRRDFTINAIGYRLDTNDYIDHYNGILDLKNKKLSIVDENTFIEDPLRLLRGIQFIARFNLSVDICTEKLFIKMVQNDMMQFISKERIEEEMKKLLLKSKKPSIGFEYMRKIGLIERFFPELYAIVGVEQSKIWHPEGDVWIHTMLALNEMAKLKTGNDIDDFTFMLAILTHDFGKPFKTTLNEKGKITSRGHEAAGVEPALKFLNRFLSNSRIKNEILIMVKEHLAIPILFQNKSSNKDIRRLNVKLCNKTTIERLALISKADSFGRTTDDALNKYAPFYDWIIKKSKKMDILNEPEKPLILGRDLIAHGATPGKHFKDILKELFERQINEEFTNENKNEFLKKFLN